MAAPTSTRAAVNAVLPSVVEGGVGTGAYSAAEKLGQGGSVSEVALAALQGAGMGVLLGGATGAATRRPTGVAAREAPPGEADGGTTTTSLDEAGAARLPATTRKGAAAEPDSSIAVETTPAVVASADTPTSSFALKPASTLNARQLAIHDMLPQQGDMAKFRKRDVSMADLRAIGRVTGDEYSMSYQHLRPFA